MAAQHELAFRTLQQQLARGASASADFGKLLDLAVAAARNASTQRRGPCRRQSRVRLSCSMSSWFRSRRFRSSSLILATVANRCWRSSVTRTARLCQRNLGVSSSGSRSSAAPRAGGRPTGFVSHQQPARVDSGRLKASCSQRRSARVPESFFKAAITSALALPRYR